MRQLYGRKRHPYYIVAPEWSEKSAGVRVMHQLCDALRQSGEDAWIVTRKINPSLNTPVLTDEVVSYHRSRPVTPIAIYPEIIGANPLNCKVVARYILNYPGMLGEEPDYSSDDLYFVYDHKLLDTVPNPLGVIMLPSVDISLFNNLNNPHDHARDLECIYFGRYQKGSREYPELTSRCQVITSEWPPNRMELARLFRRSQFLYCFENTFMTTEARLCGCPAVILPSPFFSSETFFGRPDEPGISLSLSPVDLEKARNTVAHFDLELYNSMEEDFWRELDRLIEITQTRADEVARSSIAVSDQVDDPSPAEAADGSNRAYATYLSRLAGEDRVILPVRDGCLSVAYIVACSYEEREALADTLDALAAQIHPEWELVVVADFPAPDPLWHELAQLHWLHLQHLSDVWDVLKYVYDRINPSWICVTVPGVKPCSGVGGILTRFAQCYPKYRIFFSDSDHVMSDGSRHSPMFRPDMNLDMLRSSYYLGPCLWVESDALREIGGLQAFSAAGFYDMVLRVLDAFGEDSIGHIDEILYQQPVSSPSSTSEDFKHALSTHLQRCGISAEILDGPLSGMWKVDYPTCGESLVTVLCMVEELSSVHATLTNIVDKSGHSHLEIFLLCRGDIHLDLEPWLTSFGKDLCVRIRKYPRDTRTANMFNMAVQEARGEYLFFLNSGCTMMTEGWMRRLLAHAQRTEVGVVGAKLMNSATGLVQHAGMVMGMGGVVDFPFRGVTGIDEGGYMGRAMLEQNLAAVSSSCFMVQRNIWEAVGGMVEESFIQDYIDADFCMKIIEQGYKIVWTPHVVGVQNVSHNDSGVDKRSKSMKRSRRFTDSVPPVPKDLYNRWPYLVSGDPAYNRHLSLNHRDFRVEPDIVVNWLPRLPPNGELRVLGWLVDGAPSEYRIKQPLEALSEKECLQFGYIYPPEPGVARSPMLVEISRIQPQVFASTTFLGLSDHLDQIKLLRKYTDIPFLLHIDDLISQIPKGSNVHHLKNSIGQLKKLVRLANRVVVTTQPLLEVLSKPAEEIVCIPNYLPRSVWGGLYSQRRVAKKPRVGWAGALQHGGDLAMIEQVVMELANEVEWVFFGMCPDSLRPYVEFHEPVPFAEYPAKLATLNLDLAIAPLEHNRFNECKSNLRLLEYGMMGWPVVCSDIQPYRESPVTRVPNRSRFWIEAIRERIHDLDHTEREGDRLRNWVLEHWMLEDHLDGWLEAYRF